MKRPETICSREENNQYEFGFYDARFMNDSLTFRRFLSDLKTIIKLSLIGENGKQLISGSKSLRTAIDFYFIFFSNNYHEYIWSEFKAGILL